MRASIVCKTLAPLFFSLILSGCGKPDETLLAENQKLKATVAELEAKLAASQGAASGPEADQKPSDAPIAILSYGHTVRGMTGETYDVSWHVKLRNNTDRRLPDLYVEYHWLDEHEEQLSYANSHTNLGRGEEITVTGDFPIEPRLFEQTRKIGIKLMVPTDGIDSYRVMPLPKLN